jgi:hypothetical protein
MSFTRPVAQEAWAFMTRDHRRGDFASLERIRALDRPRIAVLRESEWIDRLHSILANAEVIAISSITEFLEAPDGRFDATFTGYDRAAAYSLVQPQFGAVIPSPGLGSVPIAVAVPRGEHALLAFFNTRLGMDESLPIKHPVQTVAVLGKLDITASPKHNVSASWNFNHSRKENETFDVATYGTSANGIEGDPARINVGNLNWFTTLSDRLLNEAHFTYSRENRPRTAASSRASATSGPTSSSPAARSSRRSSTSGRRPASASPTAASARGSCAG